MMSPGEAPIASLTPVGLVVGGPVPRGQQGAYASSRQGGVLAQGGGGGKSGECAVCPRNHELVT